MTSWRSETDLSHSWSWSVHPGPSAHRCSYQRHTFAHSACPLASQGPATFMGWTLQWLHRERHIRQVFQLFFHKFQSMCTICYSMCYSTYKRGNPSSDLWSMHASHLSEDCVMVNFQHQGGQCLFATASHIMKWCFWLALASFCQVKSLALKELLQLFQIKLGATK